MGLTPWSVSHKDGLIRKITIHDQEQTPWKDLLIGHFKDDNGNPYLMVTNLWHGANTPAAERKMTITIKFADHIKSISRLSRETGHPELLQLTDHTLKLCLPGGTGDLFGFNATYFPGLE